MNCRKRTSRGRAALLIGVTFECCPVVFYDVDSDRRAAAESAGAIDFHSKLMKCLSLLRRDLAECPPNNPLQANAGACRSAFGDDVSADQLVVRAAGFHATGAVKIRGLGYRRSADIVYHSRLTGYFIVFALALSWLAVPPWANTAFGQPVPADLAVQYGTVPSPELGAAIEYKIEAVKAAAQVWAQQGRDPSPALALMTQVPAAMNEGLSTGNLAYTESLIDQAYALLMAPP